MSPTRRGVFALLTALCAAPVAAAAQGDCASCPDLRVGTGALGYGSARLTDLDSVPDQVMQGINARFDLHILSLLLRSLPLRTYDALFADVFYGLRTSDSLPGLFPGDVQGSTGFQMTLGYQMLAGVQFPSVAVLGGIGWQTSYHDIAGSNMDGNSTPLIARVELGDRKRIVLTGWTAISGNPVVGARVDVPFFRRLNLTAMYWQAEGTAEVWSNPTVQEPAKASVLMIGVRSSEVHN